MDNLEIIKYIDRMLNSIEDKRWPKKEYKIINDAFNLYKVNASSVNGMLLLLDNKDMSTHSIPSVPSAGGV